MFSPQQRSAIVTALLARGDAKGVQDIADAVGLTWRGAKYLVEQLRLVLPLDRDEYQRYYWAGEWDELNDQDEWVEGFNDRLNQRLMEDYYG